MKFKAQYDLNLTPMERLKAYGIRRAIRIAGNRAARPVKAAEVSEAQGIRLTGATAKSIRIKIKVYPGEKFVAIVGTGSKAKYKRGVYTRGKHKGEAKLVRPAKYAHLVEEGTKRSRAKPWLTRAYVRTRARYLEDVRREVEKEIAAELDRQKVAAAK